MPEYQYNTFWLRLWAGLIDWVLFLPLPYMDAWFYSKEFSVVTNFIYFTFVSALGFSIYSVLMHGKYGQTIGKYVMKIQVQSMSNERLGYKKAFLRDLVIILICLYYVLLYAGGIWFGMEINESSYFIIVNITLGWYVLEILTMLTNDKRRAIHDFIAGSVVKRLD